MRLRGVFDEPQSVGVGDPRQLDHVGALAVQVDRHQHLGPIADDVHDAAGRDREVDVRDVGEPNRGAGFEDRVQRGDERERRGDDLVPRIEVERGQCGDQRRRPVVHGDGVLDSDQLGELVLEALDERPLGHDSRAQHVENQLLGLLVERHPRDGDQTLPFLRPRRAQTTSTGRSGYLRSD